MTDLEIAYPEIVTLIEAYERALFKKMEKDPSDSDVRTAYMANLINMESIMQAHVDASKVSAANVVDGLLSELKNKERQENSNLDIETQTYGLGKTSQKNNDKDPKTWGDYTYSECTVTDINGKEYSVNDPNAPDVFDATWFSGDRENNLTEDRWFDGEEIKKKYAAKLTNKFEASYSARVTEYLDDKITGGTGKLKGSNFSIEDCLNCVIRIELDLLVPNLEIVIDFSKLLNQVKQLLQQLLNDLDPTKLFSMICDFFLKFKGNFLCPQNLIGIQLLLPTLFAKFSFDLIKFRFDWTALIGPLIKGILTFLVSLIENIPKITNPIIDCLINSITTVMKALQSIASSIDKGVNEVAGGIEKIVNRVFSIYERFLERIHEKTGGKGLIGQFGSISLESDIFKEEYKEFLKENGDVFNQNGGPKEEYFQTNLPTEKSRVIDSFVSYLQFAYRDRGFEFGAPASNVEGLSFEEITTYFLQWLQNGDNYMEFYTVFVMKQPGSREQKEKVDRYNDLVKEQTQYQKRIKKELEEEKRDKNKKYFKAGFTVENKGIAFPAAIGMKPGAKINKYQTKVPYIGIAKTKKLKEGYLLQRGMNEAENVDKSQYKWDDYVFAKYGLDIKSEYRTSDFFDIPTLNLRKAFDETIFKFVDEKILYYLRIAKSWINESVGNVVKALKALQQFIGEAFDAEFKILGEMQEILQIIRFVRLITELISNGLTNCDELRKNKDVFRSILEKSQRNPSNGNYETSNNALTVLDDDEVSNMGLDPEDHIVMVTKDRKYNSVIDLNECADVSRHLEINDYNLDLIYEGIENGTIV